MTIWWNVTLWVTWCSHMCLRPTLLQGKEISLSMYLGGQNSPPSWHQVLTSGIGPPIVNCHFSLGLRKYHKNLLPSKMHEHGLWLWSMKNQGHSNLLTTRKWLLVVLRFTWYTDSFLSSHTRSTLISYLLSLISRSTLISYLLSLAPLLSLISYLSLHSYLLPPISQFFSHRLHYDASTPIVHLLYIWLDTHL